MDRQRDRDSIVSEILNRLAEGESLRSICRDAGMPDKVTVLKWIVNNVNGFAALYDRAREMQAHTLAEDIMDIADDGRNDWMAKNGSTDAGWAANGDCVQRSRLRVETRKWLASKLFPKRYGDRQVTEISGPDGAPLQIQAVDARILALVQELPTDRVIEGKVEK